MCRRRLLSSVGHQRHPSRGPTAAVAQSTREEGSKLVGRGRETLGRYREGRFGRLSLAANSCSGRPVVPYRSPTVASREVASAARYLWAVAREIPIAAETSAADIGCSDFRNASSTSFFVEDPAIVGGAVAAIRGRRASRAASTSPAPRLARARILR